ncbi:helix-turn-helix transcriptional regulator [Pseudomonas guariconensis]|uniref:LexA family transcriptional regulator n=1 Tax=Pseudomonas guariconensis TaxID=1288410 RepID=UPI0018D6288F|nr:helix-turn-helix transcriptional regulator [Pseudomonas guariconensis]MBH3361351.1 helix-turn-helix transcriptional regulator [Pseudomonas guariconensis]
MFMTTQHSGDRLRAQMQLQRISNTELAAKLDTKLQNINNWFSRGIPAGKMMAVARALGVRYEWLESGSGEIKDSQQTEHPDAEHMRLWDDDTPMDSDEVAVPFLREVELAAGSGRFVIEESQTATLRFGKRSLRNNGVQYEHARCVTVRGNSMLPILRDGATVGVNTGCTSFADIIDGDLYVINHNGQLRVKQLYRLPTGIRLRSFNRDEHPDEDYTYQDMQDENITILGHVFWWGMYAR